MKRYTWFVVPAIIMLYCCSAEKKVLNSEKKTNKVVSTWMKRQNFKTDTVLKYIPGDTTTTLLIAYDTTTIHDTVTNIVEKIITKTRTVTNTVHDTVKVEITNNDLLKGCQDVLQNNTIVLEEHRIGEERQKLLADKWRFRFWLAVSIFGALVALVVGVKLFKPRIPGL